MTSPTSPLGADPSSLLARWQDSIVAIWTATTHGSGFLIDSNGLIAADQQVIGAATSVEVQLSPSVKVAGTVIASDAMRGVALIRIDPSIAAMVKALPLECDKTAEPLTIGQQHERTEPLSDVHLRLRHRVHHPRAADGRAGEV